MDKRYYCSVRGEDLSVDESRQCGSYDKGDCVEWSTECEVIEGSELEQSTETPQPGDWIIADSVPQSLRNLRMMDGE